jgi:hypothetical protein
MRGGVHKCLTMDVYNWKILESEWIEKCSSKFQGIVQYFATCVTETPNQ